MGRVNPPSAFFRVMAHYMRACEYILEDQTEFRRDCTGLSKALIDHLHGRVSDEEIENLEDLYAIRELALRQASKGNGER